MGEGGLIMSPPPFAIPRQLETEDQLRMCADELDRTLLNMSHAGAAAFLTKWGEGLRQHLINVEIHDDSGDDPDFEPEEEEE